MSKLFVILLMLFCHVIADYNLQGWLANAKQKEWWQENAPDKLYRFDWLIALIVHSISWTFMVMLPIAIYLKFNVGIAFCIVFFINVAVHAMVDHAKANQHSINLWVDQLLHMVQLGLIFILIWRQ